MLILIPVALLILALVAFIVGFAQSSLTLDYLSIGASALSFLLVAALARVGRGGRAASGEQMRAGQRMGQLFEGLPLRRRRQPAGTGGRGAGISDEGGPDRDGGEEEVQPVPAAPAPVLSTAQVPVATGAGSGARQDGEPAQAADGTGTVAGAGTGARTPGSAGALATAGPGSDGEEWAQPSDEELYEDEFPIADYDELRVSEIMPLLPELELDEIDMVRERELGGQGRTTILRRLDQLERRAVRLAGSMVADVAPQGAVPPPDADEGPEGMPVSVADESESIPAGPAVAARAAPAPTAPAPTALLPDPAPAVPVGPGPLPASPFGPAVAVGGVEDLEEEPEDQFAFEDEDEDEDEDVEDLEEEPEDQFAFEGDLGEEGLGEEGLGEEGLGEDEPVFPIADYGELRVAEILPLLRELEPDELELVRERETSGARRSTVLNRIDTLLPATGGGGAGDNGRGGADQPPTSMPLSQLQEPAAASSDATTQPALASGPQAAVAARATGSRPARAGRTTKRP